MCEKSRRNRFSDQEWESYRRLNLSYRVSLHTHDLDKDTSRTFEEIKKMSFDNVGSKVLREVITTSRMLYHLVLAPWMRASRWT